jgi:hypothetical protein
MSTPGSSPSPSAAALALALAYVTKLSCQESREPSAAGVVGAPPRQTEAARFQLL